MSDDKAYRDIRVYRFKVALFKPIPGVEFRADGPVPVYSENEKLIGFATIADTNQGYSLASCAIDPATPERLDLELGDKPYWMDAILEFRGFVSRMGVFGFSPTIAYVKGLALTTIKVPNQTPIDSQLGVLE